MVVKRKKTTIDSIDRAILRDLRDSRRKLSGNQIAKKVNLSASAIAPRLNNLKNKGIIKPFSVSGMRKFERTFKIKIPNSKKTKTRKVNIQTPRSRLWVLDIKNTKNK